MTDVRHQITRIRRDIRLRAVTVAAVERLSPNMTRVRFEGDELRDFESAAPDDHIKLFVPDATSEGGEATCLTISPVRKPQPLVHPCASQTYRQGGCGRL